MAEGLKYWTKGLVLCFIGVRGHVRCLSRGIIEDPLPVYISLLWSMIATIRERASCLSIHASSWEGVTIANGIV